MSTSPRVVLKGRPIVPGEVTAEAVVSSHGFNVLASMYGSLLADGILARGDDPGQPDFYGRILTGRALCFRTSLGSTSAGATWHLLAERGIAPAAVLLPGDIDSLTAAGVILTAEWTARPVVTVDRLGPRLLDLVRSGQQLTIAADGTVVLDQAR